MLLQSTDVEKEFQAVRDILFGTAANGIVSIDIGDWICEDVGAATIGPKAPNEKLPGAAQHPGVDI